MKHIVPLLALALTIAACDSGVTPDTAAPELAAGDDFAFSKAVKYDVCHNAIDVDDPEWLVDLLTVPGSTVEMHLERHGDCVCDPEFNGSGDPFCPVGYTCDSNLDENENLIADGCEAEAEAPCPCFDAADIAPFVWDEWIQTSLQESLFDFDQGEFNAFAGVCLDAESIECDETYLCAFAEGDVEEESLLLEITEAEALNCQALVIAEAVDDGLVPITEDDGQAPSASASERWNRK